MPIIVTAVPCTTIIITLVVGIFIGRLWDKKDLR